MAGSRPVQESAINIKEIQEPQINATAEIADGEKDGEKQKDKEATGKQKDRAAKHMEVIKNQTYLDPKHNRGLLWYQEQLEPTDVPTEARRLLEEYSGIKPEVVMNHIVAAREKAWDVAPYPCIGRFRFLDLVLRRSKHYEEILGRLKAGERFLDMGCCFGQEIRALVQDGVPSSNLYATDLRQDFFTQSYDLFRDSETLKSKFIAADIFDTPSPLDQLDGTVDIICVNSFFHLFDWDKQKLVAKKIITLLKARKGSMLIGKQVGNIEPGEFGKGGARVGGRGVAINKEIHGDTKFWHDPNTWKEFWLEVGKETETEWEVEAEIKVNEVAVEVWRGWAGQGTRRMEFCVRKV